MNVQRPNFSVERCGDGPAMHFVYLGRTRIELWPTGTVLRLSYTKLAADHASADLDELVDVLWQLAVPGIVDSIEVSYRDGDPYETATVRAR